MASNYWEQRILADERRATEIAQRASEEMAAMYRAQYLRVVKEIDKLKAQIDYGKPLTRTQLWNYARWSKVEESLKGFVTEAVTIDTQLIHDAINAEFERVIGKPASDYGGALGRRGTISMTQLEKNRILSGDWSGEHYSARVWKNTSAVADRMRNEITNMLVDGKSTQDIRRTVMREFGVSYNNADRLVRTEVSYVHNQTTLTRYKEMGQTQVKILIVEDGKACEVCQELAGRLQTRKGLQVGQGADRRGQIENLSTAPTPYDINAAPFLPAHPRCRCCYAPWTYSDRKRWAEERPEEAVSNRPEAPESSAATPKTLQTPAGDDILDVPGTKAGDGGVHTICKIDRKIYRCIQDDILTDEVIITNKQARHSDERHIDAFTKYGDNIARVLENPLRIFEDKDHKNTGLVVGELNEEDRDLMVILRLRIPEDPSDYKNSVISCWDIERDRLKQYIRNRKTLYKRPGT